MEALTLEEIFVSTLQPGALGAAAALGSKAQPGVA